MKDSFKYKRKIEDRRKKASGPAPKDRKEAQKKKKRQKSLHPIREFFDSYGIPLSFISCFVFCAIALAIPGPPRKNPIQMSFSFSSPPVCVCNGCLPDMDDQEMPEEELESEEEESDEEGDGDFKVKKKPPKQMFKMPTFSMDGGSDFIQDGGGEDLAAPELNFKAGSSGGKKLE